MPDKRIVKSGGGWTLATNNEDASILITAGDAAKILGLSRDGVKRLAHPAGPLAWVKTAGAQPMILFAKDDVEELARQRRKNPPRRGRPASR